LSGSGSVTSVGEALLELGAGKAALICDEGIKNAGLHKQAVDAVEAAGIKIDVISTAEPEPSASSVNSVCAIVRNGGYDSIVGLGGGSSLDTGKIASALAVNDGDVRDFLGTELIPKPGLPMVMIPTTSGTGSEVTPNAIISLPDEGRKAGVVSHFLVPDIAILDPDLTVGLPGKITASTGLDALIHSLESYIGNKANVLSDGYALQGIKLISESLMDAYRSGDNIEAREKMLVGACYGGMALTAAGTAAVHALAYATGAKYHIPHGVANSMLLVPVLERSLDACEDRLADIGGMIGIKADAQAVLAYLTKLSADLDIPSTLDIFGYKDGDLDELVTAASKVTRLLDNNPKPFTTDDIREVFLAVIGG
jgi:alcohol dehydrogenase